MNGSSRVAELHVAEDGMIVFHLAFIMSGQCEQDFDLGFQASPLKLATIQYALQAIRRFTWVADARFVGGLHMSHNMWFREVHGA
eukprot:101820-Amphidinium_carterae.1